MPILGLPADKAEPFERYWLSLGKFIDQFSAVEYLIHAALLHYSGMPEGTGRVVFSGHRIKDGVDTINRLLDARGLRRAKARLAPTFAQLGEINETRNNIIHWGADPMPGATWRVTNAHIAQKGRAIKEYAISVDALLEMDADLTKIGAHLELEITPELTTREKYRARYRPILRNAWRYKPPQRAVPPGKTPKGSQGRRRPQQSSAG